MATPKEAKNYSEQIQILESRGCAVHNLEKANQILSNINYYRFTAYLLPFKLEDSENYLPGTCFEAIFELYEFDRKLRSILLMLIETIEVSLKTKIAYFHGHKYGGLGYLDLNTFNSKHNAKMRKDF